MRHFLALSLLYIFSQNLYCDTTIVADRPGFSTGTYTVQPGKLNVELGYNHTFEKNTNMSDTDTLPLLVLRTGITKDIELDILWDGWNFETQQTNKTSSDVIIGGKYRLKESTLYNLTLMGLLTLPTGSENTFKSKNINPFIGLLWDYNLLEDISLFGTIQSSSYLVDNTQVYDLQTAIGASFSHTDKFGSFVEIYSIIPSSSKETKEAVIDGGFTYLLNDNIQIDINIGIGLTQNSNNFIGAGIALQF